MSGMRTEWGGGGGGGTLGFLPDQSLPPSPPSKFPLKLNHNTVLQPIIMKQIRKEVECSQLFNRLTLSPPLAPYGAMRTILKKKIHKKSTVRDFRL